MNKTVYLWTFIFSHLQHEACEMARVFLASLSTQKHGLSLQLPAGHLNTLLNLTSNICERKTRLI